MRRTVTIGARATSVRVVGWAALLALAGGLGTGDLVRYCSLSREVNDSRTAPTTSQAAELIQLAPPQVRGDVTAYLHSADTSDAGVQAFARIFEFESAHC